MDRAQLEQEYQRKLISAEQAAGLVQSGMSIFLGVSANMARNIDKHLALRKNELHNVAVRTTLDTAEHEFLKADPTGEVFKWHTGFPLHFVRAQVGARGSGVYWAQSWHLAPGVIREQVTQDISYIVTAPMDAHGNFNFGLSVTELMAFCEVSKKIVVVVREDMPAVCGGQEEAIHISRVDHIVEDREFKTFCLPPVPAKPEDRLIAENIVSAGLIRDGSTLQIGIGGLPNSVLEALVDAGVRHLGIHSEMLTDKMFDLIQAGIVDNSRKTVDRFKSTFSFCLGSRRLYDFVDRNPMFASYPVDYVNNPLTIAQQPHMFSLNTTMQIDLVGQVASEQIGGAAAPPYQRHRRPARFRDGHHARPRPRGRERAGPLFAAQGALAHRAAAGKRNGRDRAAFAGGLCGDRVGAGALQGLVHQRTGPGADPYRASRASRRTDAPRSGGGLYMLPQRCARSVAQGRYQLP